MILREEISRIRSIMGLNEDYFGNKKLVNSNTYRTKSYNPDNKVDFTNTKVHHIVWRAGRMELTGRGGIWFGETKDDVEKFVSSVFNKKVEGKPYRINIENPKYYDSFWHDYMEDAFDHGGKDNLMDTLVSEGYDGIIIDVDAWNDLTDHNRIVSRQYVVFNPENIEPVSE